MLIFSLCIRWQKPMKFIQLNHSTTTCRVHLQIIPFCNHRWYCCRKSDHHHLGCIQLNHRNNGINHQPQLMSIGFLNHTSYGMARKITGGRIECLWSTLAPVSLADNTYSKEAYTYSTYMCMNIYAECVCVHQKKDVCVCMRWAYHEIVFFTYPQQAAAAKPTFIPKKVFPN